MFRSITRGLARLAITAATAAFLIGVSLFLCGAFLLTWPLMRKSPREKRLRATADLAAAGMVFVATISPDRSYRDVLAAMEKVTEDA